MYLHGIVIETEGRQLSQNGNWFTRGILEDSDKVLHDFCIFWTHEAQIKDIKPQELIDLVGKKDRTSGTFMANYMREFKKRDYQQNTTSKADETHYGHDAIKGKKPIEFIMDILGAKLVNTEIKKIAPTFSAVLSSSRLKKEYDDLMIELLRIAKEVDRESAF